MSDIKKEFSRKEFYELVWSKPVITVAKEFGYSDTAIRKKCIKHNIPLPKSGYWSKVKFNKKVKKAPLPKAEDENIKIEIYLSESKDPTLGHYNTELANKRKEILSDTRLSLKVPDRLSKTDPLVKAARQDLKGKQPSRWISTEGLVFTSINLLNVEVSKTNVSRALRFMDAFVKLIKKRGHKFKSDHSSTVVIDEVEIKIRFRETLRRIKYMDGKWERTRMEPSGTLTFRIEEGYREKQWRDSKKKPLEEQLVSILATMELRAKEENERRIEHAIWRKQQDIIEAKREELQKRKDKEFDKFNQLFNTATRWHKTQYLRGFIKEYENYLTDNNQLDEDKKQYIDWAKEKADWLDPFIEKEVELMEDVNRETLKSKKRSWY